MTTRDPQDELLHRLGARVRSNEEAERDSEEAAWSRLCLGTSEDDEVARLDALAASDPDAEAAAEAFRPLGADVRRRLAAGALERLRESPSPAAPAALPQSSGEVASGASPAKSPAIPPHRRASVLRYVALAACLVLLVGGGVWLRQVGDASTDALTDAMWATSRVRSEVPGAAAPELESLRLSVSDALFLTLNGPRASGIPQHRVSIFLRREGAAPQRLAIVHEVRSQGRIELQVTLDGLDPPPGPATLVVAVHGSRYVTAQQVMGTWGGRLQDGFYGAGQRFEQEVVVAPQERRVEVEFLGCDEVLGPAGTPRCVLSGEGELRLWVKTSAGLAWTMQSGDAAWTAADGEASGGGHVLELSGLMPGSLEISAPSPDGPLRLWRLDLRPPIDGSQRDEERRVDYDTIDMSSAQGAHDLHLLARRAFRGKDYRRTVDLLEQTANLHARHGALSAQIDTLALLFYTRFEILGEIGQAKEALDSLPQPASGDAASAYLVSYYRGLWALESGDLGVALQDLGKAARHAERIGWTSRYQMAEQLMARLLRRLGRGAEANALLTRLLDEVPADCEKVRVLNNLAWDQLQDLESQAVVAPEDVAASLALLEEGLQWLDHCPRDVGDERINVQLNLALAYLLARDVPRATDHLRRVEDLTASPIPRFWIWKVDIEARLDLLAGRPRQALAKSRRLGEVAQRGFWLEAGWRAAMGEARAHLALNDPAAATAAYAAAEGWLDEQSRRVPLDADRAAALVSRSPSTAEYIDLLLRRGRAEEAFDVARQARVRLYRSLVFGAAPSLLDPAELASWIATVRRYREQHASHSAESMPGGEMERISPDEAARRLEELEALATAAARPLNRSLAAVGLEGPWRPPPLAADEAVLLFHPLTGDEWVGFAAHNGRLESHRFEASVLDDPSGLLEPFADLLTAAGRVRVLPFGRLNNLDVHALPLRGVPLAVTLPVLYGLDLPSAPRRSVLPRRALLLAAAAGDLPAAAGEVRQVEESLDDWHTVVLPTISPQAVLQALGGSDLLHFAGHADFAGRDGLDSHLRLAGNTRLSAKDLLTTGAGVPEIVVLSACSSARSSTEATSPGLGLAQAFLLRGSHMIIGATRPVDDRLTQVFFGHFYGVWDGTAADVPRALRHAQLELRGLDDNAWASFRLLAR